MFHVEHRGLGLACIGRASAQVPGVQPPARLARGAKDRQAVRAGGPSVAGRALGGAWRLEAKDARTALPARRAVGPKGG